MDKNLPVFFIAGDQDPVGGMGKGVQKACGCFKKAGLRDVSILVICAEGQIIGLGAVGDLAQALDLVTLWEWCRLPTA